MRPNLPYGCNPADFDNYGYTLEVNVFDQWRFVKTSSPAHISRGLNNTIGGLAGQNRRAEATELEDPLLRVYENGTRLIRWQGRLSTFRGLGVTPGCDQEVIDNFFSKNAEEKMLRHIHAG